MLLQCTLRCTFDSMLSGVTAGWLHVSPRDMFFSPLNHCNLVSVCLSSDSSSRNTFDWRNALQPRWLNEEQDISSSTSSIQNSPGLKNGSARRNKQSRSFYRHVCMTSTPTWYGPPGEQINHTRLCERGSLEWPWKSNSLWRCIFKKKIEINKAQGS